MLINNCLRVSYCFETIGGKNRPQLANFKMDIVPKGKKRLIWIHKDETQVNQLQKDQIPSDIADRPCV